MLTKMAKNVRCIQTINTNTFKKLKKAVFFATQIFSKFFLKTGSCSISSFDKEKDAKLNESN
jgi:hypothetical protein